MQKATLNAKVRAACSDWAVDHRYRCSNQATKQNRTKRNQTKPEDDDDDDDDDGNNKVTKKYQTNDHHSQPQLHLASVLSSTHSKVLRKSKLESSLPLYFW